MWMRTLVLYESTQANVPLLLCDNLRVFGVPIPASKDSHCAYV